MNQNEMNLGFSDQRLEEMLRVNRRNFFSKSALGIGSLALSSMLSPDQSELKANSAKNTGGILKKLHHPVKAKRVIYLFQSGGPSQLDLFDYKPLLNEQHGKELPASVRKGQRLTTMSANQASLPMAGSPFKFSKQGEAGTMMSDLLPFTAKIADDICVVKSLHTEAINHDPAITFFQTGSQIAGRPSIGSWLSYGLGTENQDLPTFCVLISKDTGGQPLFSRLWGNGFLPSVHQGVQFRAGKNPILYLKSPPGISSQSRRKMLDRLKELHEEEYQQVLDPEIEARISQYEMAYRMQTSVPEVTNMADEPEHVFEMYGPDSKKPGTYAANCLLARRLAEKDVRFIQLYHQGWDQHGGLVGGITNKCKQTDQASAALIQDLKQRGMLDATLVIWGGEFGRTNYCQGKLTPKQFGRDHHPRCFSIWMAGGGIRPGISYGETDEFGYNLSVDGMHVHDLQATLLHLLGIDHEKLTYKYQGRRFRLTDIHGNVVKQILS